MLLFVTARSIIEGTIAKSKTLAFLVIRPKPPFEDPNIFPIDP
jgi:hypothetical protein